MKSQVYNIEIRYMFNVYLTHHHPGVVLVEVSYDDPGLVVNQVLQVLDRYIHTGTDTLMCRLSTTSPPQPILLVVRFE